MRIRAAVLLFLISFTDVSFALDAVVPGELYAEPPTLLCLGFEWNIEGDDNRNATVSVEYREHGASSWRKAMPLLRIGG